MLFLCLILVFPVMVSADILVPDFDAPDTSEQYLSGSDFWTDGDVNPAGNLHDSNPATEEAWLEALLGFTYNNPDINFVYKDENPPQITVSVEGDGNAHYLDYNPGFDWDYAVVKTGLIDGEYKWWAWEDTEIDNWVSIGKFDHGISHVTFFGAQPVPEPATLILLGSGLISLAGFGRKRFK